MKGEVAKQVKPVVDEKRSLQIKHEQICAENKNLKEEKETLMKATNSLNVALKAAKKESKDGVHKLEKTIEGVQDKIVELTHFRNEKVSEEKEFRSKMKKVEKKLKSVREKEAKISTENIRIGRIRNHNYE
jgi:chromosome segregation ATPase